MTSVREIATTALVVAVMAFLFAAGAFLWVQHDLREQGLRLDGVRACVANTAYPRALLGQCLDDYATMRKDGRR